MEEVEVAEEVVEMVEEDVEEVSRTSNCSIIYNYEEDFLVFDQ